MLNQRSLQLNIPFILQAWGHTSARIVANVTGGPGAWKCTDIVTRGWNDSSAISANRGSAWKRNWPSTFTVISARNRTSAIIAVVSMVNDTNWRHINAATQLRRRSIDLIQIRSLRSCSFVPNRRTVRSIWIPRFDDCNYRSYIFVYILIME